MSLGLRSAASKKQSGSWELAAKRVYHCSGQVWQSQSTAQAVSKHSDSRAAGTRAQGSLCPASSHHLTPLLGQRRGVAFWPQERRSFNRGGKGLLSLLYQRTPGLGSLSSCSPGFCCAPLPAPPDNEILGRLVAPVSVHPETLGAFVIRCPGSGRD